MQLRHRERGDTIIEVLLSIAVLGALITISLTVMSRGFANAQDQLDRTNTQALINGQASMLRAINARLVSGSDSASWASVLSYVADNASGRSYTNLANSSGKLGTPEADGCKVGISPAENALFYFDPDSTTPLVPKKYFPTTYDATKLKRQGTVPKLGDGIWIEGYKEYANKEVYVFYIKSCWDPVYGNSGVPNQSKTVVRLYGLQ